MPTVHADCQASVDGRDLSRSVTEGLPGEVAPRFVASFADFLTDTLETGGKDLSGNMRAPLFDRDFLSFSISFSS